MIIIYDGRMMISYDDWHRDMGLGRDMGHGTGGHVTRTGPAHGTGMGPGRDQYMGPGRDQDMGRDRDRDMGPGRDRDMGPGHGTGTGRLCK